MIVGRCVMTNYQDTVHRIRKTIPSVLYHYCSKEKLHYLLEPGADLYCRYLSKQSDKTEYRFGARLVCDFIRSKGGRYTTVGDALEENLVCNIGSVGEDSISSLMPLSFSLTEHFNSPYHFKEYCNDDGAFIAFNQSRLEEACEKVAANGVPMQLIRCYYAGQDASEISALCDALWMDQRENIDRLIASDFCDEDAGKCVVVEILNIAPHLKREEFCHDNEWRILMVTPNASGFTRDGFLASGLRDVTERRDIINLMDGIGVQGGVVNRDTMQELARFALRQRRPLFKIWV